MTINANTCKALGGKVEGDKCIIPAREDLFMQLIRDNQKDQNLETDGESLANILRIADDTPYTDWRVDDLNEVAIKVRNEIKEERPSFGEED